MDIKTQIVATIGPATKDKEMIKSMIESGMRVARLNFSWGTYDEHKSYIENVRSVASELGVSIPIIQDLSGPRIQKGDGHGFDQASISPLTEKDLEDLAFGIKQGVEYVALSYVGDASHIKLLRSHMEKLGKVVPIIAKIERAQALENIDAIVDEAQAIMVARGDLGVELPFVQLAFGYQRSRESLEGNKYK